MIETQPRHTLQWATNTGTRFDAGEAEAVGPIGRDEYLTITADPDATRLVPAALAALPEVQAELIVQGWRPPRPHLPTAGPRRTAAEQERFDESRIP